VVSEGCVASSASYVLREDGQIDVVNRCSLDSPDGKKKEAIGIARIKDGNTNAGLKFRSSVLSGAITG
jgi:apolipoprotein D and lipocalin family protein